MPPISWTSKWRMPSVRCIASRVAANTSGSAASRAFWSFSWSRLRRSFASSRRRSEFLRDQLFLGGLLRGGIFGNFGADRRDALADLFVGDGLELGLEGVDLVDERLDPLDLALVRVDEAVQEAKHGTVSIGEGSPAAPSAPGDPSRLSAALTTLRRRVDLVEAFVSDGRLSGRRACPRSVFRPVHEAADGPAAFHQDLGPRQGPQHLLVEAHDHRAGHGRDSGPERASLPAAHGSVCL